MPSRRGKQRPHHLATNTRIARLSAWENLCDGAGGLTTEYSLPYKVYHGKTGVIYNVTKSAVGIIIYKKVKHRYLEKRINIRIEHVQPSRSREDFLKRVKANAEAKKQAKADGVAVSVKRQPAGPRDAQTVSLTDNPPETLTPLPYETTI